MCPPARGREQTEQGGACPCGLALHSQQPQQQGWAGEECMWMSGNQGRDSDRAGGTGWDRAGSRAGYGMGQRTGQWWEHRLQQAELGRAWGSCGEVTGQGQWAGHKVGSGQAGEVPGKGRCWACVRQGKLLENWSAPILLLGYLWGKTPSPPSPAPRSRPAGLRTLQQALLAFPVLKKAQDPLCLIEIAFIFIIPFIINAF